MSAEHSDTFDVEEVSGPGDEVGIDGIAVLVNGALVTTSEEVAGLADQNRYLEVSFVFTQAKRSAAFSEAGIGNFCFGVSDFFGEAKLPATDFLSGYVEVKEAIYETARDSVEGLPRLRLYYVTPGKWEEPAVVVQRIEKERTQLMDTGLFGSWTFSQSARRSCRNCTYVPRTPLQPSSLWANV